MCLCSAPQYLLCLHGGKFDHPDRVFNRFVKFAQYFLHIRYRCCNCFNAFSAFLYHWLDDKKGIWPVKKTIVWYVGGGGGGDLTGALHV